MIWVESALRLWILPSNFDPSDLVYIDGSLTSGLQLDDSLYQTKLEPLAVCQGGFIIWRLPSPDFSNPIAEFQMTVLETSEPVASSITGTSFDGDAAPDTIETFSYMSSTLTATVIHVMAQLWMGLRKYL